MQSPTFYQRFRLLEISQAVFEDGIESQDIEYRYEVTTQFRQRADFILRDKRNGDAMGKTIYLRLLEKLPLIEIMKRPNSGAWNCAFIPYQISKGEAINFYIDVDNVLYLDLKELVTSLIE